MAPIREDDALDYRDLVAGAADAIVVADSCGTIRLWNAAATRLFGFTAEEALGASLDLIIPEAQRARHWQGYERTMKSGVTRYGDRLLRVPALHRDGRRLSIAFTVGLLRGQDGAVSAVVAIMRDETERWQEERMLRTRLAELEGAAAHPP